MNASSDVADVNPFSPTAVAWVVEFDSDMVTIETDAIRRAIGYVSDYLAATSTRVEPAATVDAGNVIAIVGDYGTGKTHLVMQLLQYASRVPDVTVRSMYLDAAADTFLALYRRFIQKLELSEVRARVNEYYADVVADSLQGSDLTTEVAQWLRDREVPPERVVEQLGLMESALLRKVQRELEDVTRNDAFGTALTLLLRPGFDDAVWLWLKGGQPDPILVERGITEPIDTEVAALEAMGVFALLYGRKRHRFLLAIDELERVLSAANRPRADASAAFQKLLNVIMAAGSFLVLSGLPDFLQVLPGDVRQRIGRVVTMSGLSCDETCRFVEQSQQRVFAEERLEPFTRDTLDYLVRLAGGTARTVIRLCYHLYRKATDEHTLVTDDMVRKAAREHFGPMSADDVSADVRRRLQAGGWPYRRNHYLGPTSRVDYWVEIGDRGAGCAVLLSDSVLDNSDVDELARRALAVRGSAPDGEVLLVVNGVLPDDLAAQLSDTFSTEPLVYDNRSFADDFTTALTAMAQRLQRVVDADPLTVVREQVEQLTRQQSSIYGFIEQLATYLDGLRSSSDRQFGAIQRELSGLFDVVSRADPGRAHTAGEPPPPRLPAEVDQLFRNALDALDGLTQPDVVLLDQSFTPREGDVRRSDETRHAIQLRLRSGEFLEASGVAALLQKTVLAFRSAVSEWYRSHTADPHRRRLSPAGEERLDRICRTYDAVAEYLPMLRLDPLTWLAPQGTASIGMVSDITQATRRSDFQAAFDNLSLRVRQAVLRSVATSER